MSVTTTTYTYYTNGIDATYGDRGTPEFNKQIAEMVRRIAAIPLYK